MATGFRFGYPLSKAATMFSRRSLRILTVAGLASLAACGSPEDGAEPPPGTVSMPAPSGNLTGADLCALLTDEDTRALGLPTQGKPWDRPYKMGGTRRARCGWSGGPADVEVTFHDSGAAKDATFPAEAEISEERTNGRYAKVVAFRQAPMDCLVLVDLSPRAHLRVDAYPRPGTPDAAGTCAFARRVAHTATARIT
ncbi:DUF3558 family protein [Amycolatopsis samaneae]|uniref:DUF3558 family protein n=1 Tax=Amycolatopsis samaneae TaxID=664691 RepID=A0ABW5GMC2_9PSEU